jgi:ubiquinone/menaquinone biosynthesis C-methylase UbiE
MDEYAAFAAIYDDWASHMTEDVPFYLELVREADGPVVELAVGNGRVAVPIAQETGKKIIGIDRSPAMLALATEKAADAGVVLELHEGDMRDFALDEPAALVYCPFRAMLHLATWSDKRRVFERVAAAVAPGGRFVWNAFVFNPRIAAENDGKWAVQAGIRHRVDHFPGDNRLDITLESGGSVSLWWVTKSEWEGLIDVSGLDVEALYGDFERAPFDDQSGEFVWVARKPL